MNETVLICPECRRPPEAWPVDWGSLICTNPKCQKQHVWLDDEIPVVIPGPPEPVVEMDHLRAVQPKERLVGAIEGLHPGQPGWERLARHGTYLSSHYGGAAQPFVQLCDALLPHVTEPISTVLDLGCGPGRLSLEMAQRTGATVVGLDIDPLNLRWAMSASTHRELVVPQLRTEASFELKHVSVPVPEKGQLVWICGDVHHPPLAAGAFDLVLAVNLVDSVRNPYIALGQAAALVRDGGYLIFAQPDKWDANIAPPESWLANDEAGWDAQMEHFDLRTLHKVDGLLWEMVRTPRLTYRYVLHGRIAVKALS